MINFELRYLDYCLPDYFQGFGVAFTEFDKCVVGCGDDRDSAIDDLMENFAQELYSNCDEETASKIIEKVENDCKETFEDLEINYCDTSEDLDEYPLVYLGIRRKNV